MSTMTMARPDSALVYDLEQQLLENLHTEVLGPLQVLSKQLKTLKIHFSDQTIAHGHETRISTVGHNGVLHESVYTDRWCRMETSYLRMIS